MTNRFSSLAHYSQCLLRLVKSLLDFAEELLLFEPTAKHIGTRLRARTAELDRDLVI